MHRRSEPARMGVRWSAAVAAILLAGCVGTEEARVAQALADAADALLAVYPESEAEEVLAGRTPRLSPYWETGTSDRDAIPETLVRAMEQPGLARLPASAFGQMDPRTAVLSFFRPRVDGDSVRVAADWLFPLESGSFYGQEYEVVYACSGRRCQRVRVTHTGIIN